MKVKKKGRKMEWVSSWIQGIIIAVIISTIIEMILPEGNCKKYIKVVIGVYILFSMISPVITKLTGTNFKLSDILDIEEYMEASTTNTYEDLNQNQDQQIRDIYLNSLKNDMKEKIIAKGYEVISIDLEIENNESYTLQKITLDLKKGEEDKSQQESENQEEQNHEVGNVSVEPIESVNEIQISTKNTQQNTKIQEQEKNKKEELSSKEKNELKEYLSSVYEIEEKNININ